MFKKSIIAVNILLMILVIGCGGIFDNQIILGAPTNLTLTVLSDSEIYLAWEDNSDEEEELIIEYAKDSAENFEILKKVEANKEEYTASNLLADTMYYFRVKASCTQGDSDYSNIASGRTQQQSGGEFVINNNREATNTTTVTLNMNCTGINKMRFSNDNNTWSAWEAYNKVRSWPLTPGEGIKTVYAEFKISRNRVISAHDSIEYDITPPTVVSFLINSDNPATNSPAVILSIDVSGAARMRFSNNQADWSSWIDYSTTANWTLLAGDGTKTVYAEFIDPAENVSQTRDTIVLDTSGPVINSFIIQSNNNYVNTPTVTVLMSVTGAVSMRFSNDQTSWSGWEPYGTTKSWTLLPGDGTKRVYGEFRDSTGNVSHQFDDVILDTIQPLIISFSIESGDPWTNTDLVSLHSSVTGADFMRFRNDNTSSWSVWDSYAATYSWVLRNQDGMREVVAQFMDHAGNVTQASDTILLDTTPPAVSSFSINNNDQYTNRANVTLYGNVTGAYYMRFQNDTNSAWSSWTAYTSQYSWSLNPVNGPRTVTAEYRDDHDNVTRVSDTIIFDNIPPQLYSFFINNNTSYTNSRTVTLSISCSGATAMRFRNDTTSNWTSWLVYRNSYTNWALPASDGLRRVYVEVRDDCGNMSSTSDTITLDTTPPVISSFHINNNAADSYTRNVVLHISSSGGTQMRIRNRGSSWTAWESINSSRSWTLPGGEGTKYVDIEVIDYAQNIRSASDSIILDEYREVRVTLNTIYVTNDGDSIGNGELYWSFETGIEQGSNTISHYTVSSRTDSNTLSVTDNGSYTINQYKDFQFKRTPGYSLFVTCWVKEDDSPLAPDNAGSFKRTYGFDTWGIGSMKSEVLSGDGVRVTLYYTISRLD